MNVLIIGRGQGSMEMRGRQLGRAIGARVASEPHEDDVRWADVVVLIKRASQWAAAVRQYRFDTPIVWDALDFWQQPEENSLTEAQARARLQAEIAAIRPALVIGATEAMAQAAGGVCLPHQPWPTLRPTPARTSVTTVGYQGVRKYLGRWGTACQAACEARGWQFVINPPDLSACDLIVAFRDGEWDGWMCQEWKSGVKVGNAIAAGRPFISQPCAAVRELQPAGSVIRTPEELGAAFDAWTPQATRQMAVNEPAAAGLKLSVLAARYQQMLADVPRTCAA